MKVIFYIHYIKQNVKYLLTPAISKESARGTYFLWTVNWQDHFTRQQVFFSSIDVVHTLRYRIWA